MNHRSRDSTQLNMAASLCPQFVGRLAMLGISTAIIGEIITGKGALGQLGESAKCSYSIKVYYDPNMCMTAKLTSTLCLLHLACMTQCTTTAALRLAV